MTPSSEPSTPGVGPLHGRVVLVCRPTSQAADTIDRIVSLGGEAVHLPLVEIVSPADDGAALAAALAEPGGHDWIVFTSANAVDAVARLRSELGQHRIAVVGDATARAVERCGWEVAHVADRATAADLAAELPLETSGGTTVLAPLAELAGPDLVDGLRRRGADVRAVTAYRAILPPSSLERIDSIGRCDAVLLTSPSIVDRLVELVGADGLPPTTIAIGPSTAEAAGRHGIPLTAVAEPPGSDGLIDALVRTLAA